MKLTVLVTTVIFRVDCCPHCLMQLSGKRQVRSMYAQKCTKMTSKLFDKFIASVAEIDWVGPVYSDCKQTVRSSFRHGGGTRCYQERNEQRQRAYELCATSSQHLCRALRTTRFHIG